MDDGALILADNSRIDVIRRLVGDDEGVADNPVLTGRQGDAFESSAVIDETLR